MFGNNRRRPMMLYYVICICVYYDVLYRSMQKYAEVCRSIAEVLNTEDGCIYG